MFGSKQQAIVISEPDLQAALVHLRSLPFRPNTPLSWDRQYVLNLVREVIPAKPKVGDWLEISSGLYGVIKPFGVDLAGGPHAEERLQVWIAIRSVGTDPMNVTQLAGEKYRTTVIEKPFK